MINTDLQSTAVVLIINIIHVSLLLHVITFSWNALAQGPSNAAPAVLNCKICKLYN